MKTLLSSVALSLAIAAAGQALAQEQPSPGAAEQPAADAPAADSSTPAPGELNMGQEVGQDGTPGVGDTYVRDVFGDWEMRCVKSADGKDPCQLYQLLKDQDGNSVAEIGIFGLAPGQQAAAGATIITPLETLLTQQVTLAVDGGTAKRYPFTFCNRIGCFARVGFTQDDVDRFKKGSKADMTITPVAAPDEKVALTISLSGFTAGYDAVNAANAASMTPPASASGN